MADNATTAFADEQLSQADKLKGEKVDLLARIGGNRDILRNLKVQGVLSAAQVKRVDDLYPVRQKGEDNGEQED